MTVSESVRKDCRLKTMMEEGRKRSLNSISRTHVLYMGGPAGRDACRFLLGVCSRFFAVFGCDQALRDEWWLFGNSGGFILESGVLSEKHIGHIAIRGFELPCDRLLTGNQWVRLQSQRKEADEADLKRAEAYF